MSRINTASSSIFSFGNWVARQLSQRNLLVCGTSVVAGIAATQLDLSTKCFKQRKYFDSWVTESLSLRGRSVVVTLSAVALCAIASRITPLFNHFLNLNFEQISGHCVTACIGIGSVIGSLYFSSRYQLRSQTTAPYFRLEKREATPPEDHETKGTQPTLIEPETVPEEESLSRQQQLLTLSPELWKMKIFPLFEARLFYETNCLPILRKQLTTLALVCKAWKNVLYFIDYKISPPRAVSSVPFTIYRKIEGITFNKMQQILMQIPNVTFHNLTLVLNPFDDPKEIGSCLNRLIQQRRLQNLVFDFKKDLRRAGKVAAVLSYVEGSLLRLRYGNYSSEQINYPLSRDPYPFRSDQAVEVNKFDLDGDIDKDKEWRNCILGMVKMKRLSIRNCHISGPELTEILSRQPQLKSLNFDPIHSIYSDDPTRVYKDFSFGDCALEELSMDWKDFDCESLKKALATQSHLKKLSLYYYAPERVIAANNWNRAILDVIPIDVELFAATCIEELHFEGRVTRRIYNDSSEEQYAAFEEDFDPEERLHLLLKNMPSLRKLHMNDVVCTTGAFLKGLLLEELYLDLKSSRNVDGNILMQALKEMTTLKKLYIAGSDCSDWIQTIREMSIEELVLGSVKQ